MLNRLLYRLYRFLTSTRYRLGRRFTKAGLLVLVGSVMTAALGIDTEQAVAYQAFAFLACLLAVSVLYAAFFRGRFAVERVLPQFGTVGEPMSYGIVIQNQTAKTQAGLALLENLADPRISLEEFLEYVHPKSATAKSFHLAQRWRPTGVPAPKEISLPALAPGRETEARVELTPLGRGPLRFTGLTVTRADPFGLVRAFVTVPLAQSVLILPKRYFLPPIALPGTMKYQQGGVALASSVGESEEFVSLRDYRRGDPLRHLHWKSWAKTSRPIIKEFQEEFFVRHGLVLDTFAGPEGSEVFEEAVSVAASFACTIETQESLLDLMFVGPQAFCFTAGRGLAHTEQMLETLASVSLCRDKSLSALQQLVLEHATALSGCICIFLAWDAPRQELVRRLKATGCPILVLVVSEAGGSERLEPGPMQDQPAGFHALEVGKIAEGLQKL
jgi:uncharacterized protein (DUF58 family)